MRKSEPSVKCLTPQEQVALFTAIEAVEKRQQDLVEFETTDHKVKVIRCHNKYRSYVKITLTKLDKAKIW